MQRDTTGQCGKTANIGRELRELLAGLGTHELRRVSLEFALGWVFSPCDLAAEFIRAGGTLEAVEAVLARGRGHRVRKRHRRTSWRTFEEARAFARSLGLHSRRHWFELARTDARARDVPVDPAKCYRDAGWQGWSDFLGNGSLPFVQARELARGLGLGCREAWRRLVRAGQLPPELPEHPDSVYADAGWIGWPDFLRARRTFEETRAFARTLRLNNAAQWYAYARGDRPELPPRPRDVPANPYAQYRDAEWRGWRDFLGSAGPRRRQLRPTGGPG